MRNPNERILEEAAAKLAQLLDQIVFVGGAVVGLLLTDKASAPVRSTQDVDIIAEILTYGDYMAFSERLRDLGLTEDMGEDGALPLACRWRSGSLRLDVLALREEVLGYTNRWYEGAMRHAAAVHLSDGTAIRVVSAPYFLGTKMEAFRGRGKSDFAASHDLEDFVAVIDGRPELLFEVEQSPSELRQYLAEAVGALLNQSAFLDVLPGFVVEQGRLPLIRERLEQLASTG